MGVGVGVEVGRGCGVGLGVSVVVSVLAQSIFILPLAGSSELGPSIGPTTGNQ